MMPAMMPADATASDAAPQGVYWHNWTDSKGVSHLTHCHFHRYILKSMSKPAGPQWQDRLPPGRTTIISTVQPAHWDGTWHPDPTVQWIIPLRGTWFVEAMDGTRVVMGPGDLSLGEDQMSRRDARGHIGHNAGNVGDGPVTLMVIQTDQAPTIDRPCRFQ
ncbi:cupin domain-containing protein [Nguyenibacter vanlangensis]|nr:cupin domain-containing protein [Nguyenibacter vanlangensis]